MAKKKSANRGREQAAGRAPAAVVEYAGASRESPRGGTAYYVGLALIVAAAGASGVLAFEKLGAIALPGCGPASACAAAQASAWGTVPGVKLPVSFVGLGYFAGLAVAWLVAGAGAAARLRPVIRVGAAVSVFYLVVIFAAGHLCPYCIATHVANLACWVCAEWLGRRPEAPDTGRKPVPHGHRLETGATNGRRGRRPLRSAIAALAIVFVAANVGMVIEEGRRKKAESGRQETAHAESTQRIIEKTHRQTSQPEAMTAISTPEGGPATMAVTRPVRPWGTAFTGRHRWGPEKAAIRVVMYTDYQCPDCFRVEQDVTRLMETRKDLSVTVKHFPMCKDCNPHVAQTLHGNACWAARAAEAAAILAGEGGFWNMHHMLFARQGRFETDAELNQMLDQLGLDYQQFRDVMKGPESLARIQSDADEAIALGLHFTPMIFINGVELRGVFAQNALPRAVEALAATNPPAAGPEVDDPAMAGDKYVGDWREQPARMIPPGKDVFALGPENAKIKIVMFGDFLEPNTAQADEQIRGLMARRGDVQYTFRPYPVDQTCNPNVRSTLFPNGCLAARAAWAAGRLGGADAYWKMHRWLVENRSNVSLGTLPSGAAACGVSADALMAQVDSPEAVQAISAAVGQTKQYGLIPQGVPTVYVNGKWVPRWTRPGDNVLERIFNEAGGSAPK